MGRQAACCDSTGAYSCSMMQCLCFSLRQLLLLCRACAVACWALAVGTPGRPRGAWKGGGGAPPGFGAEAGHGAGDFVQAVVENTTKASGRAGRVCCHAGWCEGWSFFSCSLRYCASSCRAYARVRPVQSFFPDHRSYRSTTSTTNCLASATARPRPASHWPQPNGIATAPTSPSPAPPPDLH